MKARQHIEPDWKWGTWDGNRKLDRLLDRQLTFREKLEWLEEAETLSLSLQASREAQFDRNRSRRAEAIQKLKLDRQRD